MATTYLRTSGGILKTAAGMVGIDWDTFPAAIVAYAPNVKGPPGDTIFGAYSVGKSTPALFSTMVGTRNSWLKMAVTSDGHLCWVLYVNVWNNGWAGWQSTTATRQIAPTNARPYGVYTFLRSDQSGYQVSTSPPYLVMRSDDTGAIVTVTSANPLPRPMAGVAYSQTLTATGGTAPYTWSVDAGTLPAGITLSSAGVLSGTPSVNGDFNNITFRAFSSEGYTAAKTFTSTRVMVVSGGVNFNQAAGWVPISGTRTSSFRITNNGNTDLHVTSITHGTGFSSSWTGTIAPGAYYDVPISVTIGASPPDLAYYDVWPQGNWPAADALTITSDASSSSGSAYFSIANYNDWSCD